MERRFENQVAVVTGGSKGIGYAISEALALEGAKVYLVARGKDRLEQAQSQIISKGARAEIRIGDVTKKGEIESIIDDVYLQNNRLDIFVNNAGEYKWATTKTDESAIREIMELDFFAPYRIANYLSERAKILNKPIKILNVLSQSALKILSGGIAYGAAKGALKWGLLHTEKENEIYEREKNKPEDIKVKIYRIYPGTVLTESTRENIQKGIFQNPTTLESVVNASLDLILNKTPTRDILIGYIPGIGIKRAYIKFEEIDPENIIVPRIVDVQIVDPSFDPSKI